jgi:6-phospho-3-hexuloisomerase
MGLMGSRIAQIAERIEDDEVDRLIAAIRGARRVFVMGAGRSGLVAKAFAMRLMHLGLQSYVVGETITPSFGSEDVMVIFSGSGRTRTVGDIASTAKEMGGTLCVVTANPTGGVATLADVVVEIESNRDPGDDESCEFERRQMTGAHKSFAPLGTLFETTAMVFADAIISVLMELGDVDEVQMKPRHTNLE